MDGSYWQGYGQPGVHDPYSGKVYPQDPGPLGMSIASTAQPDSWGDSMAAGNLGYSMSTQAYQSADLDSFGGFTKFDLDSANLTDYPRIITAARLLDSSDDESTWCGPPSEPGESAASEKRSMEIWGIGDPEEEKDDRRSKNNNRRDRGDRDREGGGSAMVAAAAFAAAGASRDVRTRESRDPQDPARDRQRREPGDPTSRRPPPLIQPRGDVDGDNQKFICVFQIGLDDDEEFCLVKRILGKAGNNMRRIAEEFNAKVRLRGIGSGFLEGADGREANMPLQLNLSCTDFDSYEGSVDRVSTLLKDLYKHYRRYARSKGQEPPEVKVSLEEVRRDDVGLDLLQQKAQRSPSQRERDRRQREKERQLQRDKERERLDRAPGRPERPRSRERLPDRQQQMQDDDDDDTESMAGTLPGGLAMPTTAAGRRLAARSGGAEHAAIVSAAARDAEKLERDKARRDRDENRDKDRDEREQKKKAAAERAAAIASRTRGGPRVAAKPPAAASSSATANFSSPAKEDTSKPTSSPAKPTDSYEGSWKANSWESQAWEEFDPWASAAANSKGKGKSSDESRGKGSGKKK